jgi:hypothetical protein
LLYIELRRLVEEIKIACHHVGLSNNMVSIKQWLGELQSYSLIKMDEPRDRREPRITLNVNSEEIK